MIICDTSGLIAAYSARDRRHADVMRAVAGDRGPLVLSPFVLAELDYLVLTQSGVRDELKVLDDVAAGVYQLAEFDAADIGQAGKIITRYRDLGIGLTDASVVVLAAKLGTTRVLTLDEKHFRVMRPNRAAAFTLLPADG